MELTIQGNCESFFLQGFQEEEQALDRDDLGLMLLQGVRPADLWGPFQIYGHLYMWRDAVPGAFH